MEQREAGHSQGVQRSCCENSLRNRYRPLVVRGEIRASLLVRTWEGMPLYCVYFMFSTTRPGLCSTMISESYRCELTHQAHSQNISVYVTTQSQFCFKSFQFGVLSRDFSPSRSPRSGAHFFTHAQLCCSMGEDEVQFSALCGSAGFALLCLQAASHPWPAAPGHWSLGGWCQKGKLISSDSSPLLERQL